MDRFQLDFALVGAMKSGTSYLADLIGRHSRVSFSVPKETDFFLDAAWEDGIGRYADLFEDLGPEALYGEGSTSYTKFGYMTPPDLASRLKRHNPAMKILYVVRDPVDRIVSHWRDGITSGWETLPFPDAIRSRDSYVLASRYHFQISHYLEAFGPGRIHVLLFEDLVSDVVDVLERVFTFLGIPPEIPSTEDANRNPTDRKLPVGWRTFFASTPARAVGRILPSFATRAVYRLASTLFRREAAAPPEVNDGDLAYLALELGPDLERFTDAFDLDTADAWSRFARATRTHSPGSPHREGGPPTDR